MRNKAYQDLVRKDALAVVPFFKSSQGGVMCLRFTTILITGTVLAVSSLAHAKTPSKATPPPVKAQTQSTISASGLAQVAAILTYCQVVDSHSFAKYQRVRSLVISGHSSAEISDDERSAAYLSELKVIGAQLVKVPASAGISSCRTLITGL